MCDMWIVSMCSCALTWHRAIMCVGIMFCDLAFHYSGYNGLPPGIAGTLANTALCFLLRHHNLFFGKKKTLHKFFAL